ncbi:MAG: glycerol kinase [Chloroflexota bacterium]|nr:glycerol kinase [Chloroflexota bacterium]
MKHNILAIDQGTTNTKALLVDPSGRVLARGNTPTAISYPQPGWVEQDARDIWRGVLAAIEQCLAPLDRPDLAAVAISNQRETALIWERATGRPLGPAVVWQCHRSASFCNDLKARGFGATLQERTGLQLDPMFSASKLRWLLDHIPDGPTRAADGELCAGNVDAWLLWNLTGGRVHATDMTNASRTQLMALRDLAWDVAALGIFGIPAACLPEIRPSSAIFGETIPLGPLPGGVPIASLIGDSHASLYGLGGFRPGSVKATYGTGSSLMTPTSTPVWSGHGLSTTVAWARASIHQPSTAATNGVASAQSFKSDSMPKQARASQQVGNSGASQLVGNSGVPNLFGGSSEQAATRRHDRVDVAVTYALEGNIYATGAAVQWVGDLLGLADSGASGPEVEKLARSVTDTAGVYFVPALTGLGAPHWAESARGLIAGLTRGAGAGHLARAALEAIAYQVRDVFDVMQAEAGTTLDALLADGGASSSDLLMQFQADMLGCAVLRSSSPDISPLGAAFLAGLAVGIWSDEAEIARLVPPRDRFEPQMPADRRAALYEGWRAAVARTLCAPQARNETAHGLHG